MLRSLLGIPALCIALITELALVVQLVANTGIELSTNLWVLVHLGASVLAAIATASMLRNLVPGKRPLLILLFTSFAFFMPLIGAVGTWMAVTFGAILSNGRHQENIFWQFTNNADLPFAAPIDRPLPKLDSRGFIEQLMFDKETDKLYNKVAATRHIRDSQSAPLLKSAVGHENERIRLVAYQMLDKKINNLNKEIQNLENDLKVSVGTGKANIHLQVANTYWELLTIEEDEPVAREELLAKAERHAAQAVGIQPGNANAHFILGRIYMKQEEHEKASNAFVRSTELGMPNDKTLPYIAEVAFLSRNFKELRSIVSKINPAFKSYPPFSQVIEYWA